MWAACKAVARAVEVDGGAVQTVEILDDPHYQDLTTLDGFLYAVRLIMRVQVGGIVGMAPVCSNWIFANMVNTKRNSANPAGDRSYEPVVAGNLMAKVVAFCLLLAFPRSLCAFLENPAASLIFKYPPVECALSYLAKISKWAFGCYSCLLFQRLTNWKAQHEAL